MKNFSILSISLLLAFGNCNPTISGSPEQPPDHTPEKIRIIKEISPIYGPIQGGMWVYISGEGFTPDMKILFQGIPAQEIKWISELELYALLPDVSSVLPDGGKATLEIQTSQKRLPLAHPAFIFTNTENPLQFSSLQRIQENANVLAVRDWNQDNKPDLALNDYFGGNINFYRGNGDGTFSTDAVASYPVDPLPLSLAVGDFNQDHYPDIVVTHLDKPTVAFLIYNPSASHFTFQPAQFVNTFTPRGRNIAVGDFDGDSYLDVAVAQPESSRVSLLFGQPLGIPQMTSAALINLPTFLVSADLDGNHQSELLVGSTNISTILSASDRETFLIRNTFSDSVDSLPGQNMMATLDVNQDGYLDLALLRPEQETLTIYTQQADGTFVNFSEFPVPQDSIAIASGDLNHDGLPDLIVRASNSASTPNELKTSHLMVFLNQSDGKFMPTVPALLPQPSPSDERPFFDNLNLVLADINGDGHTDVILSQNYSIFTSDEVNFVHLTGLGRILVFLQK